MYCSHKACECLSYELSFAPLCTSQLVTEPHYIYMLIPLGCHTLFAQRHTLTSQSLDLIQITFAALQQELWDCVMSVIKKKKSSVICVGIVLWWAFQVFVY